MTEKQQGENRQAAHGNRLYWLLAILALPIPAALAYVIFPIGCRCFYGSAQAGVFQAGLYLIWIRLLIGLTLGEDKKKTVIYLALPFVVGFLISMVAPIIWTHAH